jgi:hypothetical protein
LVVAGKSRGAGGNIEVGVMIWDCGRGAFVVIAVAGELEEMEESSRVDFPVVDDRFDEDAVEVVDTEAGAGYLERLASAAWMVGRTGAEAVLWSVLR